MIPFNHSYDSCQEFTKNSSGKSLPPTKAQRKVSNNRQPVPPMKRLLSLAIILLTSFGAMAQQKTVNIVTVNNPDMIALKKLASKFEAANPDIKLNWLVLEENIMRQRI